MATKKGGTGWKKYEAPPNMLAVEEKLSTLQLTDDQVSHEIMTFLTLAISEAQDEETEKILKTIKVTTNLKKMLQRSKQAFVEDFLLWIQGRSLYNDPDSTVGRTGLDGTQLTTPWGQKKMTFLPGVSEFLDGIIAQREEVVQKLSILKMRGPRNINDLWIYYKYLVRGIGIDFANMSVHEQRMFNDYDWRENEFLVPGPDGEPEYSPEYEKYKITNPAPMPTNTEVAKECFKECIRGVRAADGRVLQSDEFATLSPQEKIIITLLLNLKGVYGANPSDKHIESFDYTKGGDNSPGEPPDRYASPYLPSSGPSSGSSPSQSPSQSSSPSPSSTPSSTPSSDSSNPTRQQNQYNTFIGESSPNIPPATTNPHFSVFDKRNTTQNNRDRTTSASFQMFTRRVHDIASTNATLRHGSNIISERVFSEQPTTGPTVSRTIAEDHISGVQSGIERLISVVEKNKEEVSQALQKNQTTMESLIESNKDLTRGVEKSISKNSDMIRSNETTIKNIDQNIAGINKGLNSAWDYMQGDFEKKVKNSYDVTANALWVEIDKAAKRLVEENKSTKSNIEQSQNIVEKTIQSMADTNSVVANLTNWNKETLKKVEEYVEKVRKAYEKGDMFSINTLKTTVMTDTNLMEPVITEDVISKVDLTKKQKQTIPHVINKIDQINKGNVPMQTPKPVSLFSIGEELRGSSSKTDWPSTSQRYGPIPTPSDTPLNIEILETPAQTPMGLSRRPSKIDIDSSIKKPTIREKLERVLKEEERSIPMSTSKLDEFLFEVDEEEQQKRKEQADALFVEGAEETLSEMVLAGTFPAGTRAIHIVDGVKKLVKENNAVYELFQGTQRLINAIPPTNTNGRLAGRMVEFILGARLVAERYFPNQAMVASVAGEVMKKHYSMVNVFYGQSIFALTDAISLKTNTLPIGQVINATEGLYMLKAIQESLDTTRMYGREMARMILDPSSLSKKVVTARDSITKLLASKQKYKLLRDRNSAPLNLLWDPSFQYSQWKQSDVARVPKSTLKDSFTELVTRVRDIQQNMEKIPTLGSYIDNTKKQLLELENGLNEMKVISTEGGNKISDDFVRGQMDMITKKLLTTIAAKRVDVLVAKNNYKSVLETVTKDNNTVKKIHELYNSIVLPSGIDEHKFDDYLQEIKKIVHVTNNTPRLTFGETKDVEFYNISLPYREGVKSVSNITFDNVHEFQKPVILEEKVVPVPNIEKPITLEKKNEEEEITIEDATPGKEKPIDRRRKTEIKEETYPVSKEVLLFQTKLGYVKGTLSAVGQLEGQMELAYSYASSKTMEFETPDNKAIYTAVEHLVELFGATDDEKSGQYSKGNFQNLDGKMLFDSDRLIKIMKELYGSNKAHYLSASRFYELFCGPMFLKKYTPQDIHSTHSQMANSLYKLVQAQVYRLQHMARDPAAIAIEQEKEQRLINIYTSYVSAYANLFPGQDKVEAMAGLAKQPGNRLERVAKAISKWNVTTMIAFASLYFGW